MAGFLKIRNYLVLLMFCVLAGWLQAKPINVVLNSGPQFEADLLWANDSLLYLWTGFDAFDASNLHSNAEALPMSGISKVGFGYKMTTKQAMLWALTISIPASLAKVTYDESAEDITLPLVFYSALLAFPMGYLIKWIHNESTKPRPINAMNPVKLERKIHNFCKLNSGKHGDQISQLEKEVKP